MYWIWKKTKWSLKGDGKKETALEFVVPDPIFAHMYELNIVNAEAS